MSDIFEFINDIYEVFYGLVRSVLWGGGDVIGAFENFSTVNGGHGGGHGGGHR